MKAKNTNHIIFIVYAVLAVAAVCTILFFTVRQKPEEPVRVGFITSGNVDDEGWNAMNYRCIKQACDDLGAELITVTDIPSGQGKCQGAVNHVVGEGAGMVILNSSFLAEEMKDKLDSYPNVSFYAAASDFETANLSSFSGRMYQARYLSGIVAGSCTKTGKIGFVAAFHDPAAYRGINAFAMGVQAANPDAEVIVAWTDKWDDPEREKALAKALIEKENADVLTYHQNKPYTIEVAEEYGIFSIGYYEPMEHTSEKYLTCAMCDWTMVYEKMIKNYINGQGNAFRSEWLGIETGTIMLTDFSPLVPPEAIEMVNAEKKRITDGRRIFSGEIYDNKGEKRCEEGEAISDAVLMYEMDWLLEGVREYAE